MAMMELSNSNLIKRYREEMKNNPCIVLFKTENCNMCVGVHRLMSEMANRAEFDDVKFYLAYADKGNIIDWVNKFLVRSVPAIRSMIGGKPFGSYEGGYYTEKKITEFINETREEFKAWKAKEEAGQEKSE